MLKSGKAGMFGGFALLLFLTALVPGCGGGNDEGNRNPERETSPGTEQSEEAVPERFAPRQLPNLLLEGEYVRVYRQTSGDFQEEIGQDQFVSVSESALKKAGEFRLVSEIQLNDMTRYAWKNEEEKLGLEAIFDEEDTIHSMLIKPMESHPETDEALTETTFQPPFRGDWLVFWGGTNVLVNYHYDVPGQRYAYDFVRVRDGYTYKGDKTVNESYYAFGEEVLAPAAGKVVKVVDGIPDNEPVGQMNTEEPAGNHVVIDHGNGEFSFIAHFRNGSIQVKEGDTVEAGDLLGQCGNSGNSSEPHIHFHVSDGPSLTESRSLHIRFAGEEGIQGDTMTGF